MHIKPLQLQPSAIKQSSKRQQEMQFIYNFSSAVIKCFSLPSRSPSCPKITPAVYFTPTPGIFKILNQMFERLEAEDDSLLLYLAWLWPTAVVSFITMVSTSLKQDNLANHSHQNNIHSLTGMTECISVTTL